MPNAEELTRAVQALFYGHRGRPSDDDHRLAWKAVKAVASGDGSLAERERLCLVGRMAALLTPPAIVDEVLAWEPGGIRATDLLERAGIPAHQLRAAGAWVLYNGLSVAVADGQLAPGERAAAAAVADATGLSGADLEALVSLVAEEAAVRRHRIALVLGPFGEPGPFAP